MPREAALQGMVPFLKVPKILGEDVAGIVLEAPADSKVSAIRPADALHAACHQCFTPAASHPALLPRPRRRLLPACCCGSSACWLRDGMTDMRCTLGVPLGLAAVPAVQAWGQSVWRHRTGHGIQKALG
jgi:hypothetical protein